MPLKPCHCGKLPTVTSKDIGLTVYCYKCDCGQMGEMWWHREDIALDSWNHTILRLSQRIAKKESRL